MFRFERELLIPCQKQIQFTETKRQRKKSFMERANVYVHSTRLVKRRIIMWSLEKQHIVFPCKLPADFSPIFPHRCSLGVLINHTIISYVCSNTIRGKIKYLKTGDLQGVGRTISGLHAVVPGPAASPGS